MGAVEDNGRRCTRGCELFLQLKPRNAGELNVKHHAIEMGMLGVC